TVGDLDELLTELHVVVTQVAEQISITDRCFRDIDTEQIRGNPTHFESRLDNRTILELVPESHFEPAVGRRCRLLDSVRGRLSSGIVPGPGAFESTGKSFYRGHDLVGNA